MDSTQEIIKKLGEQMKHLKNKYPISAMALFGSYARNEQTETSDIDIMVEFNGKNR